MLIHSFIILIYSLFFFFHLFWKLAYIYAVRIKTLTKIGQFWNLYVYIGNRCGVCLENDQKMIFRENTYNGRDPMFPVAVTISTLSDNRHTGILISAGREREN